MAINLPDGYQLDSAPSQPSLPNGYVLDEPQGVTGAVTAAMAARPELRPYGTAKAPTAPTGPVGGALDAAMQTISAPIRLGQTLMKGPDVTGEAASDIGAETGYPKTGAAIGTAIQMAPLAAGAAGLVGGLGEAAAPELERIASNQTLKSLGGSMGQIRQMTASSGGRAALDEAAKYARENGLTDLFSTSMGREQLLKQLEEKAGSKIGAFREEAGTALNPEDIESKITSDPRMQKYMGQGSFSGEQGSMQKALADIQEQAGENPSHADLSKASTFINQGAAGQKVYQPVNAATDVANRLSEINNEGIASSLGPEKNTQYQGALDEYSNLKPLQHLQERGELREMASRGGWNPLQGAANTFGYRASANAASNLAETAASLGKAAPIAPTMGGVTTHLMSVLGTNPQSLGKYASPLLKAAQTGGNQGLAATHFLLSSQYPDYNEMMMQGSNPVRPSTDEGTK